MLLPDEPGNAAERLREAGIEVVTMPLRRLRATRDPRQQATYAASLPFEVRAVRRLIRDRRIDLVLISGLVNPHGAIAAHLERVPVVWQIVDTRTPTALRRVEMPAVRRLADVVMFDGRSLMPAHGWTESERLTSVVYYPPVDTQRFRVSAERGLARRSALNVDASTPVIGTVANMNPQKGVEYFVRAAREIAQGRPDATFVVVGAAYETHAEYTRQIREEVSASGIPASQFIFAGERSDLECWYPAMDVKLITSVPRSEGTTTTALEAMACGVPVVATDVGAVREVVEDGVTGLVVPPLDAEALARATLRLLDDPELRRRMGEVARERAVARYDVETCADVHVRAFEAAFSHHRLRQAPDFDVQMSMAVGPSAEGDRLRDLLVCPGCREPLRWADDSAHCESCGHTFPVIEGIPVLLIDQSASKHDELEHEHAVHGSVHKQHQAAHFDRADAAEFEVTRPHGAPALHRYLLAEKFRRSIRGIEPLIPGATALTVCGGSGMDAEFLSRAGAQVIASDISLGAAQRTAERARRYGLPVLAIVADVERLPFRDRSVDLVYVHDGLHHLERPAAGLSEMGRVAGRAVSITEPAQAFATQVAVRLRWALEREEAGNRVARLTPSDVSDVLRDEGLHPVHRERYAMYYRHVPGAASRLLSLPGVISIVRPGWRLANTFVGRWGNKLTVQAVREEA